MATTTRNSKWQTTLIRQNDAIPGSIPPKRALTSRMYIISQLLCWMNEMEVRAHTQQ
jgi:hypothetical protein